MKYPGYCQSVLLYGRETWTITPVMLKSLRRFNHNRMARMLACRLPELRQDSSWSYPRVEDARRIADLFDIEHYISIRQRSFIDKVATRPIRLLCDGAERQTGAAPSRLYRCWWTQETFEQEGAQAVAGIAPDSEQQ